MRSLFDVLLLFMMAITASSCSPTSPLAPSSLQTTKTAQSKQIDQVEGEAESVAAKPEKPTPRITRKAGHTVRRYWQEMKSETCLIKRDPNLFQNGFRENFFKTPSGIRITGMKPHSFVASPSFPCGSNYFSGVAKFRFVYTYTFKGKEFTRYADVRGELENGVYIGPVEAGSYDRRWGSSRWGSDKYLLVQNWRSPSGSSVRKMRSADWKPYGSTREWYKQLRAKVDAEETAKESQRLSSLSSLSEKDIRSLLRKPREHILARTKITGPPSDPKNVSCTGWLCLTSGTSKEVQLPFKMEISLKGKMREKIIASGIPIQVKMQPAFFSTFKKNGVNKKQKTNYNFAARSLVHGSFFKAYELNKENGYSVSVPHKARVALLLKLDNGTRVETSDVKGAEGDIVRARPGRRYDASYGN